MIRVIDNKETINVIKCIINECALGACVGVGWGGMKGGNDGEKNLTLGRSWCGSECFGRKVGSPRGLDFEEMAAKLLSRRHHSSLWCKWGVGPSNEMLKQKSLQNHSQKWSKLEMCFVLTFPGVND